MKLKLLAVAAVLFALSSVFAGEPDAPVAGTAKPTDAHASQGAQVPPATSAFARHFDQLLTDSFQPTKAPTATLPKILRPLPSSVGTSGKGTAASLFEGIPTQTLSLPNR